MRFRESFTITLFSQGVILVSGFINSIIITRSLGPIGRGEYAMVNFMVTLLMVVLGEGINRSNIYFASRDHSEKNLRLLGANLVFYSFLMTLLFILLALLPDTWYARVLPGIKPVYIYLGFATTLFFIFNRQFQGLFLGLQQFWHYNFSSSLPVIFFLCFDAIVYIVTGTLTTTWVLVNYLLSMAAVFAFSYGLYFHQHGLWFTIDWQIIKENFAIGWRATVGYLLIFLLIRVNLYIVNFYEGLAEAGLFAVSVNIATLIQQVPNVAGVVLLPKVSDQATQNKLKLSSRVALVSLVVSLVTAVFFFLMGERLLIWLYKKEFAASFIPLAWLLPGIVLFSVASIYNTLLWGRGFPLITLWGPFVSLLVNLVFCYLLIPGSGIIGAAQAATISYVVYSGIIFVYVALRRKQLNA